MGEDISRQTGRRKESRRSYYKDSYFFQDKSDTDILSMIRGEELVKVARVKEILQNLSNRQDFQYSQKDWEIYGQPLLKDLEEAILNQDIPCYANPEDPLPEGGYMLKSHLAAFIAGKPLPDGGDKIEVMRHQLVERCVEGHFDKGWLGEFQRSFDAALPMRTASTVVVSNFEQTKDKLNLRTPFLLAVGYAPDESGMEHGVPKVGETLAERARIESDRKDRVVLMNYRGVVYYRQNGRDVKNPPAVTRVKAAPENNNGPEI